MINKWLGKRPKAPPSADSSRQGSDRRTEARQPLLEGLAVLELNDSVRINVTDISKGGLGARFPAGFQAPARLGGAALSVAVLGKYLDADLDLVHTHGPKLGFAWRPREPEVALSIETLVERLADGASMHETERSEHGALSHVALTNDRGVRLSLTFAAGSSFYTSAELRFWQWGQLHSIQFGRDGLLAPVEHDDLRSGLLILVGIRAETYADAIRQLIALGIRRLREESELVGVRFEEPRYSA